jgi:hypothetical protein
MRRTSRRYACNAGSLLSEGRDTEVFGARSEGDDPNAPVFGALDPADQALPDETVPGDTDRAWGEIDDQVPAPECLGS